MLLPKKCTFRWKKNKTNACILPFAGKKRSNATWYVILQRYAWRTNRKLMPRGR